MNGLIQLLTSLTAIKKTKGPIIQTIKSSMIYHTIQTMIRKTSITIIQKKIIFYISIKLGSIPTNTHWLWKYQEMLWMTVI